MPTNTSNHNQVTPARKSEKAFVVLLKGLILLAILHLLVVIAISTGIALENSLHLHTLRALSFMNHKMLAWTGLFFILLGIPLTKIILFYATKNNSPAFYCLSNRWTRCFLGFLAGVTIAVATLAIPLMTGFAFLVALPNRLIPQEIVASILTHSILMLLIAFYLELIYRGILMCEWTALWTNRFLGISAMSLMYAIVNIWYFHGNVTDKMIVFISGLIFAWFMAGIMIHTQSINLSIGLHAGWYYGLNGLMGCRSGDFVSNLTPFVTHVPDRMFLFGTQTGFQHSLMANFVLLVLSAIVWSRIDIAEKHSPGFNTTINPDAF
jgi:hypothetical protein